MRLNQGRERGPRNHNVHLTQEALSARRLVVECKTEAREAFLSHGGPAQRLNGQCETESENQGLAKRARLNQRFPNTGSTLSFIGRSSYGSY